MEEKEIEKRDSNLRGVIDFAVIIVLITAGLVGGFFIGQYDAQYDGYQERSELFWTGCGNKPMTKVPNLACSGSMRPTISCVNEVYYCAAGQEDINVGDIIIFSNERYNYGDGQFSSIMHRVVEIQEGGVVTKGDVAISPDPKLVLWEDIFGKVGRIE